MKPTRSPNDSSVTVLIGNIISSGSIIASGTWQLDQYAAPDGVEDAFMQSEQRAHTPRIVCDIAGSDLFDVAIK